tara:strand:+ start:214 stop:936 length:723 start_codon:yes stop_codon:yes gene_type:complete
MSQSEFVIVDDKKNQVSLVIDTSGSMGSINPDGRTVLETVIKEGITEILDSQTEPTNGSKNIVDIITFNSDVNIIVDDTECTQDSIKEIKDKLSNLYPSRTTALCSAICQAINRVDEKTSAEDTKCIVILTDGQENSSDASNMPRDFGLSSKNPRQFTKDLIQEKQNMGWKIIFIGTDDLDRDTYTQQYGLKEGNTISMNRNAHCTQSCYRAVSDSINRTQTNQVERGFSQEERTRSAQQ